MSLIIDYRRACPDDYVYHAMQDPTIRFYLATADIILSMEIARYSDPSKHTLQSKSMLIYPSRTKLTYRLMLGSASWPYATAVSYDTQTEQCYTLGEWLYKDLPRMGLTVK